MILNNSLDLPAKAEEQAQQREKLALAHPIEAQADAFIKSHHGRIILLVDADGVHTADPEDAKYWLSKSAAERIAAGWDQYEPEIKASGITTELASYQLLTDAEYVAKYPAP